MIVSTTLSKNNESIIQDALLSVLKQVDACLLIDTGSDDETINKALEVAGEKLIVRTWTWQNDFSAARNISIEMAHQVGADWALTVDSDERIQWNDLDLRDTLSDQVEVYSMIQANGTYEKPRILKIPTQSHWVGRTHEFLSTRGKTVPLPQATFWELPKTSQEAMHKFERDIEVLKLQVEETPTDPRWHFYLAESYRNAGFLTEAGNSYEACAALKGWDEEAAWACFKAAEIRGMLGDRSRAIQLCTEGLGHHPGMAELAWLAAFHSFYLGKMLHAIHWARLSISMGMYQGHFNDTVRIGFRDLPSLWEKPYDVLRFAFRHLGQIEAAAEAEHHWRQAQSMRQEKYGH